MEERARASAWNHDPDVQALGRPDEVGQVVSRDVDVLDVGDAELVLEERDLLRWSEHPVARIAVERDHSPSCRPAQVRVRVENVLITVEVDIGKSRIG